MQACFRGRGRTERHPKERMKMSKKSRVEKLKQKLQNPNYVKRILKTSDAEEIGGAMLDAIFERLGSIAIYQIDDEYGDLTIPRDSSQEYGAEDLEQIQDLLQEVLIEAAPQLIAAALKRYNKAVKQNAA